MKANMKGKLMRNIYTTELVKLSEINHQTVSIIEWDYNLNNGKTLLIGINYKSCVKLEGIINRIVTERHSEVIMKDLDQVQIRRF
ncbi:MAG: hypothetical protein ACFFBD_09905 [Candidatus Hodarchaeota archaeon]